METVQGITVIRGTVTLTISNPGSRCRNGLTRRGFLRLGAFGAGLTLADLLRCRAEGRSGPVRRRARSAIMVYLPGGPSHLDTYDPKPDAPREFRGEFASILTNAPGVRLCELLPLHARMMDKVALLRSVTGAVDDHADALLMTGYSVDQNRVAHHPSFGAVVSRIRGDAAPGMPPFVTLRVPTIGVMPSSDQEAGYLGIAHRPFPVSGPGMADLRPLAGSSPARNGERVTLLTAFDTLRRDLDATGTMSGMDTFTGRALEMVTSGAVLRALDLEREDTRIRDRYRGVEQLLLARRLVEAGVGCVTVSVGEQLADTTAAPWDTHTGNFRTLRRQLPILDRGVATLVQDLFDRGLADEVVTVVWGEFGRTPRVNGGAGRDHWTPVMSALVAGGGLRMGQVVGMSSSRGEHAKERPYRVGQVLSTLYGAMGIDPAMTFPNHSGRPVPVLDDREPVRELL